MTEPRTERDGVMIDESVHEIYKQLTEGTDPVNTPLRSMKDVFMWAVCLGYERGERRPITGKKVMVFRWAQFTAQTDVPLLKAVAIAATADINVLRNRDDILTLAEEYANAGIFELRLTLEQGYNISLWELLVR